MYRISRLNACWPSREINSVVPKFPWQSSSPQGRTRVILSYFANGICSPSRLRSRIFRFFLFEKSRLRHRINDAPIDGKFPDEIFTLVAEEKVRPSSTHCVSLFYSTIYIIYHNVKLNYITILLYTIILFSNNILHTFRYYRWRKYDGHYLFINS